MWSSYERCRSSIEVHALLRGPSSDNILLYRIRNWSYKMNLKFLSPQLCITFLIYCVNASTGQSISLLSQWFSLTHLSGTYPNITSAPSLPVPTASCGNCTVLAHLFEFSWISEILTFPPHTIVYIVDNSTNVTQTSTIQTNATWMIPTSLGAWQSMVHDSVITTTLGGITYTL